MGGVPGQTFRGDIFVGRVFDDNEDVWRRESFTLNDCSTDAAWVAKTKAQRANRSSSDVANLASQIGAKNPAHITPSMLQDATPQGETDDYTWRQTEEEVEITFKTEGLQKGDKKSVTVNFSRKRLNVVAKGKVLFDAELAMPTQPDESIWTLSDSVLQITLAKAESESWSKLLKA